MLLMPILVMQGRRTRRRTPRLPPAQGPCHGRCGGSNEPSLKLLAIGESTVAGVGVADMRQALGAQTASKISERYGVTVEWHSCGRNGATIAEALPELLSANLLEKADVVLVAFGVNDTTAFRTSRRWRNDVETLLDRLQQHCSPRYILLCGVPPLQRFPALPQPLKAIMGLKAWALNRKLVDLARGWSNLIYVPIRLDPDDRHMIAQDGYHPSACGYAAWAAQLSQACPPLGDAGRTAI